MIGIIPAAGKGSRLGMGSKPLVNYKGKYLIEYSLLAMLDLGIKKAIIIQNEKDIENVLGEDYHRIQLIYVTQKEKKGIAHAISLTEDIANNEDLCIILGDVYFEGSLRLMKEFFEKNDYDCLIPVKKINDVNKLKNFAYGITNDGKFIEKPLEVENLKLLQGLALYMMKPVIFDIIRILPKSERFGELEITDSLNYFKKPGIFILEGEYRNINTKEDLL